MVYHVNSLYYLRDNVNGGERCHEIIVSCCWIRAKVKLRHLSNINGDTKLQFTWFEELCTCGSCEPLSG